MDEYTSTPLTSTMSGEGSFIDDDYTELFSLVERAIKNKKITADNVVYLAGVVMEIVEKQNMMTGYDKKQFVVNSLKEVVRISKSIADEQKPALYMAIQTIVPGAIDLIVAGASGNLFINIPMADGGCFGCVKPKETPAPTVAKELFNKKTKSKK